MRKPRPLADLLGACLGPALRAQGFAAADVILAWPDIVGDRLAAFTQPVKLEWKRKAPGRESGAQPDPGTLVVRVEGAFALEMQHLAPQVVERVNAHYGWRCVGKLVLKQGPVRRLPAPRRPARPLSEAERVRVDSALAPIAEDRLRDALSRLGRAVLAQEPGSSRTKP
jgi:hypothetical protein